MTGLLSKIQLYKYMYEYLDIPITKLSEEFGDECDKHFKSTIDHYLQFYILLLNSIWRLHILYLFLDSKKK